MRRVIVDEEEEDENDPEAEASEENIDVKENIIPIPWFRCLRGGVSKATPSPTSSWTEESTPTNHGVEITNPSVFSTLESTILVILVLTSPILCNSSNFCA